MIPIRQYLTNTPGSPAYRLRNAFRHSTLATVVTTKAFRDSQQMVICGDGLSSILVPACGLFSGVCPLLATAPVRLAQPAPSDPLIGETCLVKIDSPKLHI